MNLQQVKDMIIRAVNNDEMLHSLAQRYLDTATAHERLRHKGYGGDGIDLLTTVGLVPFNDFPKVKERQVTI